VTDYCTTGDLARRLGVPVWAVRRAADRELTDPPRRAAGYRLLAPEEAARVEQALRDAGRVAVPTDR
jgi:DNA-binding transcriptional MerR regulator